MTQSLADMRRDYTRDGLSEANAPAEPFALFRQWFDDAVKTEQLPVEPNAMTLATVDANGRPHCRVLLLKGLDERGFTFFSNYESAKGEQLAARPLGLLAAPGLTAPFYPLMRGRAAIFMQEPRPSQTTRRSARPAEWCGRRAPSRQAGCSVRSA